MPRCRFGWSLCLLVAAGLAVAQEPAACPLAGKQVLPIRPDVRFFVLKDGKWEDAGQLSRPVVQIKQATADAYRVQAGEQDGWVRKADVVALEEAGAYFSERIGKDPNDAFVRLQRAISRSERRYHDYDGAIADLDEAVRLQPRESLYRRHRGLIKAFKKDFDGAMPDLDESIRLDPTSADAYNKRAHVRLRKRDFEHLLPDIEKAIRLEPRNGDNYSIRAQVWFARGDRVRGWADLDKAVEVNPDVSWFYASRARAHQAFGELAQAIAELDRAIALEPNVATLYVNRCDVHYARADRKSALADVDRALKIDPTNAPYYLVKFALLGELERFDEAADVVTEALRRCAEDSANLHAARAHARASKKDHAGALADLDVAVREAPDNVTYRWMRVEMLAFCPDPAVRNLDRAADEAAAVAELPGAKDAESLQRVAFYCDLAGRGADAERWRARADKLKPPPPSVADLPPLPK